MENVLATIVEHKFLPLKIHLSIMRIKVHINDTHENHVIEVEGTTEQLLTTFDFKEINGKYHLADFNGRKCHVQYKEGAYTFVAMIS